MTNIPKTDPFEAQLDLEDEMIEAAKAAFWERVTKARESGREGDMDHAGELFAEWVPPLAGKIQELAETKPRGKTPKWWPMVGLLDAHTLAFLTLRRALGDGLINRTLQDSAEALGTDVLDEVALQRYKAASLKSFELAEKASSGMHEGARRRYLLYRAAEALEEPVEAEFDDTQVDGRFALGLRLLRIVEEEVGLIQRGRKPGGIGKSPMFVLEVTEHVLDLLDTEAGRRELHRIDRWPMIYPPKPWTDTKSGGYWTAAARRRLRAVKGQSRDYYDTVDQTKDFSLVWEALNAVQDTSWRVNDRVLEVLMEAEERGVKMPHQHDYRGIMIPPRAPDEATAEDKRAARNGRREAFEARKSARSKFLRAQMTVSMAERFVEYPVIYFPHNYDFRGRMYPIPTGLSPQSDDLGKALLEFAEPRRLGEDGLKWLAIHGANLWGLDKEPFEERELWAHVNTHWILGIAENPLEHLKWTQADGGESAYQFLAWAFEWALAVRYGEDFESTLPVHLDGTCNGIQHLSAIALDPRTASAVNMLPTERPEDIYRMVAERTTKYLQDLDDDLDGWRDWWLDFGLDRKIAKRSVMTLPYGSTRYSATTFVEDAIRARIKTLALEGKVIEVDVREASKRLVGVLWAAIKDTVPGARATMQWLQAAARVASKAGIPMEWETPDGFFARMHNRKRGIVRVESLVAGKLLKLQMRKPIPETVDVQAQVNGMAPNFVHSLDGAALRYYVRIAKAAGLTSFAAIHDSYGAHAADVEAMSRLIREAFIALYDGTEAHQTVLGWLSANDLTMPEDREFVKGTLDLSQLLTARYFFM